MNRRNFIRNVLAAGAGFQILPGAGRLWRVQRPGILEFKANSLGVYKMLDDCEPIDLSLTRVTITSIDANLIRKLFFTEFQGNRRDLKILPLP